MCDGCLDVLAEGEAVEWEGCGEGYGRDEDSEESGGVHDGRKMDGTVSRRQFNSTRYGGMANSKFYSPA